MGLTKQYLRYISGPIFNIIANGRIKNIAFVSLRGQTSRFVAVGACENVGIWDTRTGEKVLTLNGDKHLVSVLRPSPTTNQIAVGYDDGMVRLFDFITGECLVTFSGHKSAVSCLEYDLQGMRLVSGSKDTSIIVWDIVSESGLCRFSGHKGPVTRCCFLDQRNVLVSSSKDALVKFWDLDTYHCFKTVVGHRSEIWDMVILKDDKYLVTGCSDSELRVWKLTYIDVNKREEKYSEPKRAKQEESLKDDVEEDTILSCIKAGTVLREGRDRVTSLEIDASRSVLICHGNDHTVELFQFYDEEEINKRFGKRQRKAKKKMGTDEELKISLQDEVSRLRPIKASGKVKAVDINLTNKEEIKLAVLLGNNSFELYQMNLKVKEVPPSLFSKLTMAGHRTDVRAMSFSSDNIALATGSGEALKIWNRSSQHCIRTMSSDYILTLTFAPGDRHVIVGTKTGKLQLFDVASGRLLEEFNAHEGEVWSVCLTPDFRGFASGGADKSVKFWRFELIEDVLEDSGSAGKRLTLVHTKTLQLEEDVLCVRFSPDHRLIAVSLLDSTVKIFFVDTLKFFLSLYGHKFPALCMDISYDSTLIITGGADRNIKIWGLDFGDCHKSIFAHDDSIMGLQFISKTHLFFSCGKDGRLKQWDADNFESIITLHGHHGQIWNLAVSNDGKFVATCGHDRSLRLWLRTQEPLVLEDERETEREAEADQALATGEDRLLPGQKANEEATLPGKKTAETERAAERIMEAVDVHKEVSLQLEEYKAKLEVHQKQSKNEAAPVPPQPNPIMLAYNTDNPDKFLLEVLRKVKSNELEEALLVLPFHYVSSLLVLLEKLLKLGWETELLTRILIFLMRIHHGPLSHSPDLLPLISRLKVLLSL